MTQDLFARKSPFALRELLVLTTLAALATWQIAQPAWSVDERWLLGLAAGGGLIGILVGRVFGRSGWPWSLLFGFLGGAAGARPAVGRLLAQQAELQPFSPKVEEITRTVTATNIAGPLVGLVLAGVALALYGIGLWTTSTHRHGLVAISRQRPWLAAVSTLVLVSIVITAPNFDSLRLRPHWSEREFIPIKYRGLNLRIREECVLAVSRDGRFVAMSVSTFQCKLDGAPCIWVYDLHAGLTERPLQGFTFGGTPCLSFGNDCDELAIGDQSGLSVWSLPQGEALTTVSYRALLHRAASGITWEGIAGPVSNQVLIQYDDGFENYCCYLVDAHSGKILSENPDVTLARRRAQPTQHIAGYQIWASTKGNCVIGSRPQEAAFFADESDGGWKSQILLVGRLWRPVARDRLVLLDSGVIHEFASSRPFSSKVLAVALSHDGAVCVAATREGLHVFDVPKAYR